MVGQILEVDGKPNAGLFARIAFIKCRCIGPAKCRQNCIIRQIGKSLADRLNTQSKPEPIEPAGFIKPVRCPQIAAVPGSVG